MDKDNPDTYCYLRKGKNETLFVAGNFTTESQIVKLPKLDGHRKNIISNFSAPDKFDDDKLDLPPYGTVVYLFSSKN